MPDEIKRVYFSDLEVQALIDGALSQEQHAAALARIIESPDSLQQMETLKNQKDLLRRWWESSHRF